MWTRKGKGRTSIKRRNHKSQEGTKARARGQHKRTQKNAGGNIAGKENAGKESSKGESGKEREGRSTEVDE